MTIVLALCKECPGLVPPTVCANVTQGKCRKGITPPRPRSNPEMSLHRAGLVPNPFYSHLVLVQQGPSVRVAVQRYSCKRQIEM